MATKHNKKRSLENSSEINDKTNTTSENIPEDSLDPYANVQEKSEDTKEYDDDKSEYIKVQDEYDEDTSDEEDIRNTVGNIPMKWYGNFPHLGYDWDGRKIMKPIHGDKLDEYLNKMEDPEYWRTVYDKMTGQKVVLSDEDVDIVQRILNGRFPDAKFDPHEPWIDFFSHETMIHPVTNRRETKASFIPSLVEKRMVDRMHYAIKMGWMKPPEEKSNEQKFYNLWTNDEEAQISKRLQHYLPPPKMKLPGHEESFNPPPEYLLTKEEKKKWKLQHPEERQLDFLPHKYSSLRNVPAYSNFIQERFERCLDLYLCPRVRKVRNQVDPEDLIPKLPKAKDLQPFPSSLAITYKGHKDIVRCVTVEPSGQYIASGSDDQTVKVWEVSTGRCLKTIPTSGPVKSLAWCPSPGVVLLAAVVTNQVLIINPGVCDKLLVTDTDNTMRALVKDVTSEVEKKCGIDWQPASDEQWAQGIRYVVTHPKDLAQVVWHGKGDYFATLMPRADTRSVLIHQLSRTRSQQPLTKCKGLVQAIAFHPVQPYLYVASQQEIRIYNLKKQELTKKLRANANWISSIAIHPGGDNFIAGSYDCKLAWFDTDLSTKPYRSLKHHSQAIRQVAFHRRYPLFASASDDGTVIVFHGMVYSDLMQNATIVPVKILRGHKISKSLGVLDCQFHPTQPWIFSSGADCTVRLYT